MIKMKNVISYQPVITRNHEYFLLKKSCRERGTFLMQRAHNDINFFLKWDINFTIYSI